ncbi:VOC family protein [Cyclobacterium sp. 1_MG-2023]|uniref:VOC family protein n=1 Tax=Cyclobacterium sp. 1_MG-2023 TaxID=3062681 RepID=UPI0026E242C5|nr:VOC family protein [Cyclobacterium sp. 1_MG-2023]MDO6435773.1 VOC family protein [Cyclobacterium sp. 1_MG-2023]
MQRIEHIAIWTKDLEKMRAFYLEFFELSSNEKYYNPKKKFSSYFLSFKEGARIELMHSPLLNEILEHSEINLGLTHFAISVGSKENVDFLTEKVRKGGYKVAGEPRFTGDGYYESVITDPDGNTIEITI